MARVALLVTVLAAVAYISQAIPVPENVEDEQIKSKEIFDQIQPESKEILDQVQPESKEILDQVQPESKEILDQNQPKSEEILDQIQPKSEESLDQSDDTSKNELEDSKNKDWHDHHKENILEILKRKLEILEDKWKNNQWKNKGIERKIERIQQRTRRNTQYAPIDITNDIGEIFTDQLSIVKDALSQFKSFVQNDLKEIPEFFLPIINEIFTQIVENENGISEKVEKLGEKFKEIFNKFEDYKEDLKEEGKDFFKNIVNKLKDNAKKIIENLKEQPNQEKIGDIFNKLKEVTFLSENIAKNIFKNGLNAYIEIIYNVFENFKKTLKAIPLNIIKNKINNFENAKQIITDVGTIFVKKVQDFIEEGAKIIENENGKINNILKEAKESFNNEIKPKVKDVIEESKDKIGEVLGNISKTFDSPLNRFKESSKGILSKIKRD